MKVKLKKKTSKEILLKEFGSDLRNLHMNQHGIEFEVISSTISALSLQNKLQNVLDKLTDYEVVRIDT